MSSSFFTRAARLPFAVVIALVAWAGAVPAAQAQPQPGRPAAAVTLLTFDGAFTGRTDFEARGRSAGSIAVARAGLKLSVPLPPLGSQWFPSVGLDYRHYDLDRSAGTPLPDELRSIGTSLSVFGALNADWRLIAAVSPRLANAGGGFTSRGFGVGALALATRKFSANFSAGFGVVYDSLAEGTGRILPVVTFDWKPAPAWRVFLGFPRTGASWQVRDGLKAEFVAEADFGSFYVTDDPLPFAAGKPALNRTHLEYQAVHVGPALTWDVSPNFQARLAVGAVPLLNADYDRRGYKLESDGVSAFAALELGWKF